MSTVPDLRIREGNSRGRNSEGSFVLYWMTAFRRLGWNFSLQHAADLAREMGKPLVILELLKVDYPFASHRFHAFLLEGMKERTDALAGGAVLHYPFVEEAPGAGDGLVAALGQEAVVVVTDDYPSFFLPSWIASTGDSLPVGLELVDSNGLLPLRAPEKTYGAAYHFRRYLQKTLPDHLPEVPDPAPLEHPTPGPDSADGDGLGAVIPARILDRWPPAREKELEASTAALSRLPLDDAVAPVPGVGTTRAGEKALQRFVGEGLERYAEEGNDPDAEATSGLSPSLHFGTLSSHQVFRAVAAAKEWTPMRLSEESTGAREGWWGMGKGAEAFLDQLVTWRELGFNMSARESDVTSYDSLPEWARNTLAEHEGDPREHTYSLQEFQSAETHEELWNAAQRQLLSQGVIHNYLRMLWGKMILAWSPTPHAALEVMLELNDRYALDGRDPNSYSGIFWCLGRYDRGWPERPVFGKVRSMTPRSTRRKIKLDNYLEEFSS